MGKMSSHELYLDMRANTHKLYDDHEWEMKEVRHDGETERRRDGEMERWKDKQGYY